jgi:hypothetical protein
VKLGSLQNEIEQYAGEAGFEQIAQVLGVARPLKQKISDGRK